MAGYKASLQQRNLYGWVSNWQREQKDQQARFDRADLLTKRKGGSVRF